ncbi:MAG: hypothetical protein AAGA30_17510, partial [Planctomycetota bacterium]
MVKRCLVKLSNQGTTWIGDRTPTTVAPLVIREAPHFVMLRDFRDVLVSRMFHLYNHPRVTTVFDRSPDLAEKLQKFQDDAWHFNKHPEKLITEESLVRDSAKDWKAYLKQDADTFLQFPELSAKRIKYEELHQEF